MPDKKEFPKCPECGRKMARSGWGWSGRTQYRRYKCSRCGAAPLNYNEPRPE